MRRMGAGFVGFALAVASCTSAADDTVSTTSITLDAPEAVVQNDSIIRYGLSTSPSDPWAHYRTGCDTSCGVVLGAITDTLFATSTSGETVGLLVDRVSSNNDNTVHTWLLREGIVFSDGTEFDGAAAKINIDACRHSALTGPGLAGIDDVRADGQTLTITTLAPWGNLAVHFAETPCGHMFSGAWLRSLPDLPMRSEGAPFFDPVIAELAPVGDPTRPIGLGAFVMTAFAPGNGNSTLLERNESYWRGPDGITGESFPSTDQVEFVVIGDEATRTAGLEAGQFDLIHSSDPVEQDIIDELGPSARSEAFADIVHLAMNASSGDTNPLALVSCRRAVDRSLDRSAFSERFGRSASTGPFVPFDTADTAEEFDAAAAAQWGARCVESVGEGVSLRLLASIGDERAEFVTAMIDDAIGSLPEGGGVAVELVAVEPQALALAALLGDFDLLLWEGFAGTHPDLHFPWWYSEAAAPVGEISTNVGRINDPALDRALVDLRRADTVEDSRQAADDVRGAFDAGAWTSWLTTVSWTIGFSSSLETHITRTTPEGIELVPLVNGVHTLHHISEG